MQMKQLVAANVQRDWSSWLDSLYPDMREAIFPSVPRPIKERSVTASTSGQAARSKSQNDDEVTPSVVRGPSSTPASRSAAVNASLPSNITLTIWERLVNDEREMREWVTCQKAHQKPRASIAHCQCSSMLIFSSVYFVRDATYTARLNTARRAALPAQKMGQPALSMPQKSEVIGSTPKNHKKRSRQVLSVSDRRSLMKLVNRPSVYGSPSPLPSLHPSI